MWKENYDNSETTVGRSEPRKEFPLCIYSVTRSAIAFHRDQMNPSDQRRKRKRIFRQSHLCSVRLILSCLCFISLIYLLSYPIPSFTSSAFRPVLVVSTLSLLSSSTSNPTKSVQDLLSPKIDSWVLFPDHVLLSVSGFKRINKSVVDELQCVYHSNKNGNLSVQNPVSVDEYDGFRPLVRCPLPPLNYSAKPSLMWRGKIGISGSINSCSWENVTYAAALDGATAVLFVKGLNLRADRESDPTQFTCYFGLGGDNVLRSTKALTAAQEVVRCPLPPGDLDEGIRVTVGVTHHGGNHVIVPSVARIFSQGFGGKKKGVVDEKKYNLCVCSMVWNQASAIREWIMYHSWLGVERWFIYDNNSDDAIDEVIQQLDHESYNVTRHVWPWIKTQEAGFSHCALRARDECNWVSFMDVDEYFHFPYQTPYKLRSQNALRDLIAEVSSSSRSIGEIRTSCHSFGPSGLSSAPPQGVMVGYTCRLQSPERHKSIVRPDALDRTLLNVVHHFHLKKGYTYMNMPQGKAVINHYKYQVWEVFKAKFYRRVATYVADWQENQNEGSRDRAPGLGTEAIEPPDWPRRFCEVWDSGLRDFILANLVDSSTGLLPWETTLTS